MAAEGEKVLPRSQRQDPRRGRGNGRSQSYDPRRSEPREPAYAQGPKNPSRPAPVIQRKRSFTGMVNALLGRKPPTEE